MASFHFTRARRIEVDRETVGLLAGETIRLFFSYRYTPERVRNVLARHGLEVCEQWIVKSARKACFFVAEDNSSRKEAMPAKKFLRGVARG